MADISKIKLPNGTTYTIKDSQVPSWAKQTNKPSYTASEVGALSSDTSYAGSATPGGTANRAMAIPFGQVDSTSTATAFTATVKGITELSDGVCCYLTNHVVTSASGFTIDINDLGAKPVYSTLALASRSTTIFNVNYTMLFVYNSTRVSGGCWDCFYGYDSNTNTIGYQIRRNNGTYLAKGAVSQYKIVFTYSPTQMLAPTTSTGTGTTKTMTTQAFDPFGAIFVYTAKDTIADGHAIPVGSVWEQYTVDIRYSFNCGSITTNKDVYVKCSPVLSSGKPTGKVTFAPSGTIVQTLPTTDDGYVYIHLGHMYSTTAMVLALGHPVYYHKDGAIRIWTVQQDVPTKTSDLTNDSGFITSAPVASVNGKTGAVNLTASDVGALPSSTVIPDPTTVTQTLTSGTEIGSVNGTKLYAPPRPFYFEDGSEQGTLSGFEKYTWNGISGVLLHNSIDSDGIFIPDGAGFNTGSQAIISQIPTATSQLTNDSGFITSADVPEGSTASTTTPKMNGTAAVGTELAFARGDHVHPSDTSRVPTSRTVNGKALSANITLSASDVGALPDSTVIPTISDNYDSDSSDGMSGKAVDSAIDAAFVNHWDEMATIYYVMVSGSSASIINTNGSPASYEAIVMDTRSAHSAFFVQPINSTYMRSYVPVSLDSGGSNVILTSVEGQIIHVVNVADGGSGLVGVHNEVTLPTKVSQLTNDAGYITSAPVDSVNSKTGAVVLDASDVGAVPATMCQATGTPGTPSMSAGSYAQIVLISSSAIMVGDGFSITSDGGIKCTSAGTYKVSGSIFMGVTASGGATLKEAYVSKGTTYNNSSRVVSGADSMYVGDGKAREGAVPIAGKLVQASAGDAFYLYCRIFNGAGYCSNANKDTFLLVEKVQ